jgi:UDP-3-O-[3-hydroxymyristoyl] glucosamine N-acyltransferase
MKIEKLCELDQSFKIEYLKSETEVLSITDLSELKPNSIIFIKNKKFKDALANKKIQSHSLALVFEKKYFETLLENEKIEFQKDAFTMATVSDVNLAMSFFSKAFYDLKYPNPNDSVDGRQMVTASIHPTVTIAQGVFVGENVNIGANSKIHSGVVIMSGVEIGSNCEIYPNVVLYRNVILQNNIRLHAGVVIGADGYGYNFYQGEHLKVWHMGSVIIHDNVEIGANSCIDSGTFSPTIIGAGTKIDNLVQIGHNSKIGKNVIICGHTALAGSCKIGDYVVIGGKVAISNGVEIGTGAQVAGMAGVISDVKGKEIVGGFPARDTKEWLRGVATLRKLSIKN